MESWEREALDLDDSDLPSLLPLRPSNKNHRTLNSQSNSILHRCSQPTPTTTTQTQSLIPGPARSVQVAMLRKARDSHGVDNNNPIPTQEYIRRVLEEGAEAEDFKRDPWLWATEFLRQEGGVNSTPLSSIKKCLDIGKVDKVVAIIKCCTPNGLGDMIVTLKDPTGTVDASIHRRVLTEWESAKDISVDSVLILQEVAVFAPSRSALYLNITLSNLVKIISKDSGFPLKQNYQASAVKNAAPNTGAVSERTEGTGRLQKGFYLEKGREEIMAAIRQHGNNARRNSKDDNQMERSDSFTVSGQCSNASSRNQNAVGEEPVVRQDAANKFSKGTDTIDIITDDQGAMDNNDKWPKGGHLSSSQQCSSAVANLVKNCKDQETQTMNGMRKRLPLTSTASLPQWTDEQLNELFAMDCEDGDSLV